MASPADVDEHHVYPISSLKATEQQTPVANQAIARMCIALGLDVGLLRSPPKAISLLPPNSG